MAKSLIFFVLRLLVFVVLQGVVYAAAGGALMSDVANTQSDAGETGLAFPLLIAIQGVAIGLLIAGSAAHRARTAGLVFAAAFATGTALTQIDTAIFLGDANAGFLRNVVLLGAITSLSAAAIGVYIFKAGWLRPGVTLATPGTLFGWVAAAGLIALFHIVIYFSLGYWLVWVHAEARTFYGSDELLGFGPHLQSIASDSPWLFAAQFLRGLIFAGVAIMIFLALSAPRWARAGIMTVFFFAYFAAPLIVPNPFMPENIRQLHFVETGLTCLLMGLVAVFFIRPYGAKGLKLGTLR